MTVLNVREEAETNRASRENKVLLVRHDEGMKAGYSEHHVVLQHSTLYW